jgi:hypothetical protein
LAFDCSGRAGVPCLAAVVDPRFAISDFRLSGRARQPGRLTGEEV